MTDTPVFDKLAGELNTTERRELLERIGESVTVSDEPLRQEAEESGKVQFDEEYGKLSFVQKLLIFLRGLLTGKNRDELTQEVLLRDIRRFIVKTHPGFADFTRSQFTSRMHEYLQALRDATSLLREPIAKAVRQGKEEFVALFAGSEMGDIQERLNSETDPFQIADRLKVDDENQIRKEMDLAFEGVLAAISSDQRQSIYGDIKALSALLELCFFRFDEALQRFSNSTPHDERVCRFEDIRHHLLSLSDRLIHAQFPPSKNALQSVLLFHYQERLDESEFDLKSAMVQTMSRANTALSAIRTFNRDVPIVSFLRVLTEDVNYSPSKPAGGEDWFVLYKGFWRKRLDERHRYFVRETRRRKLAADALTFLETSEFSHLPFYRNDVLHEKTIACHSFSLMFLLSFHERIFLPKMNRPLRILHINGDFYKEDNRVVFTDAYDGLGKIGEKIQNLEASLSPVGELGKRVNEIRKEPLNTRTRAVKTQKAIEEADKRARVIIEGAVTNLTLLAKVLLGILHGEVGGEYDTLSNLGDIAGRENRLIVKSWGQTLKWAEQALELLKRLLALETK